MNKDHDYCAEALCGGADIEFKCECGHTVSYCDFETDHVGKDKVITCWECKRKFDVGVAISIAIDPLLEATN